jgi:hypothetical protein
VAVHIIIMNVYSVREAGINEEVNWEIEAPGAFHVTHFVDTGMGKLAIVPDSMSNSVADWFSGSF